MSAAETVRKTFTESLVAAMALTLLGVLGLMKPQGGSSSSVAPINVTVIGAAATPRVQATIYSSESCLPCRRYAKEIRDKMPAVGWIIKDATESDHATAHIVITKTFTEADDIELLPTTVIRRDGKEVKRVTGFQTAERLADLINEVIKCSD